MVKYLALWTLRSSAPWPTDPTERLKMNEMLWAMLDDLIEKGEVSEFGWFLDGRAGYAFGEGDGATTFKNINMFTNYFDFRVEEVLPYEVGKQIFRALFKAAIEVT